MRRRILFLSAALLALSRTFAQAEQPVRNLDLNAFYGSVLLHNTDISHLIRNHPSGIILGWNTKTFGSQAWQSLFNYPDTGISFVYQDMRNETLGQHFGLYAHYNFYFFQRSLQLRIGQGVAYNTNPYDATENFRNNAYGTHLLSSTYLMLQYYRQRVWDRWGFRAGLTLVHYSNANLRAPNTSTNTFGLTAGILYDLSPADEPGYRVTSSDPVQERLRVNLAFRSGVNESDVVGSGQFPFYIFSAYADKRLGRLSAIQLGTDIFYSNFLKELIRFQATAFPELGVDPDADYKRAGAFIGHELFINKLSVITQLGYYVYYPFDFEGRTYNRVGLKRYFGPNWFGALSLKSHGAKAEALEFAIGIRL
ncbi:MULTISPECIES: acyloxyacyl hydrolase [Robiginitalea]|uniref:acyloxyacyl hydrolase n=1 Tax=Robiginitalea TaxID=252306 RepID=UPI000321C293|nr:MULTISPECIES: acyloxyacyl hydrolase [Robiginitalea]MDC6354538.1 acyloxyacyl hydrolase [Robiginitalea sp. PM2]MDC6374780.1 acyloxyacyl hydrolase [Robiginitalea sp. SP8]